MFYQGLIQINEPRLRAEVDFGCTAEPKSVAEVTRRDQIETRAPVCVIDDDGWVCDSLCSLLESYGFEALRYGSGEEFLEDDRRDTARCIVIDQHMPGLEGLDVVAELRRQGSFGPVILVTGRLDAAIAHRADQLGVLAALEKPFPVMRLVELIRKAANRRN